MRSFVPLCLLGLLVAGPAHSAGATATDIVLPPPSRLLFSATGVGDYAFFGNSVAGVGDFNGDGYADVIVGAPGAVGGTGQAYIFFGGPNAHGVPDVTLTGHEAGEAFGTCVAGLGDVNGDGYADVIVGTGLGYGRAYVCFGGPGLHNAPDLTLSSTATRDGFGTAVAGAGDLNSDGYDDIIVGAYLADTATGRAYVYFGGPQPDSVPDLVLKGSIPRGYFGYAVAGAGDVNGDGFADIVVGADGGAAGHGEAYVYFGGPQIGSLPDLTLTGEVSTPGFGAIVSGAGDVNGDGYADVAVYAHGNYISSRVYVFYGGPGLDAVPDITFTDPGTFDFFGIPAASAGDLNGDGFGDLIIGAPGDGTGGWGAGRAFVYYGGTHMDTVPDLTFTGEGTSCILGQSVAGAGDVDGDGYPDLIVGEPGWAVPPLHSTGRVFVISTHPTLLTAHLELDPRVINLKSHAPWITAYIEPSGFDPSSIVVSSLRLAGSVPVVPKFAVVGDYDADGLPDLMVKFARSDLDPLLHLGMNNLEVTGSLLSGGRFRGVDSVRVIDPGHDARAVSVAPNPLNPSGLLRFETAKSGPVRVQVFDLQGRLVRTLLDEPQAPAGTHQVRIGALGGSGVYFARVQTDEGVQTGRIVVLK